MFGMAVPALATIIMDPLLGIIDTAIVGHLGGPVLAGVGLGAILSGSFNWIFGFLSVLTIPIVAKHVAAGQKAKAVEHVGQVLWVSICVGLCTMAITLHSAPALVGMIGGEPAMMQHAIDYMRARCIANPFVLTNFVMIGCFRGIRDTKTPLYAALIANISHLLLDFLFVFGLHLGASGAALATSISQAIGCSILFGIMVKRGFVQWQAFAAGPKGSVLKPFLAQGAAVSVRTITVLGVIMSSSSVIARVDTVTQAAHEILRQLWIFLFQFVECINISNQSITAAALGANDVPYAVEVVKRHLLYAVSIVSVIGALVLCFSGPVFGLFTSDATVTAMAASTIPLLVAFFPADATASILDGTLTASGQALWTAQSTTIASAAVIAVLWTTANMLDMTLFRAWCCLKLMVTFRLPFLLHRTFVSHHSPLASYFKARRGLEAAHEETAAPHTVTSPARS